MRKCNASSQAGIELFPAVVTDNVVTFTVRDIQCALRYNDKGYWEANIPDFDEGTPRWYGRHPDAKTAELWVRKTLKCDTLPENMTPRQRSSEEIDRANRIADHRFIDTAVLSPMRKRNRPTVSEAHLDIQEMAKQALFGKTGS